MKKKITALLCMFVLLFGGCGNAEPGGNPEVTEGNGQVVATSATTDGNLTDMPDATEKVPTHTSAPSPTVMPTLSPTPQPVASPVPMATPEPTPIPMTTPDPALFAGEPSYIFSMGDNVQYVFYGEPKWHEEYKGNNRWLYVDAREMTLVVKGTGATKDCTSDVSTVVTYTERIESPWSLVDFVSTIVIEEGITRIGDYALAHFSYAEQVYVPSTLKELGERAFNNSACLDTVWYGLDISKLSAEKDSFLYCTSLKDNPEAQKYMVAPTPTPGPTLSPKGPSPTPRADVTQIPGDYSQHQLGENVWGRLYDNGILHVVGSGSTWDYDSHVEAYNEIDKFHGYRHDAETVIVEEGITRIGDFGLAYLQSTKKIILPSSLKEVGSCAFYGSGDFDGCKWEGLTPEKWKIKGNSLLGGRDFDKVPEYAQYCQVFVPAADPENPKLRHTMQMGDNVTLEFWDNGYLYVKGSGKMWNKTDIFHLYSTYQNEEGVLREICDTITHVVVEEGITYIGNQNFLGIGDVEEVWLPSTLTQIAREQVGVCFQTGIVPKIMHCYHEGEPITIEVLYKYGRDMCKPFKILDQIKYPEKYWDSLEWYEKDDLEEYRIIPED